MVRMIAEDAQVSRENTRSSWEVLHHRSYRNSEVEKKAVFESLWLKCIT